MTTLQLDKLESLCDELSSHIRALRDSANKDEDPSITRKARKIVRQLADELTDPEDQAVEQTVTLSEWASIRLFMKWGLFDKIPLEGSASYQELAASIGAEEALVSRIGQMLVSTGKLVSPAPGRVSHSRLSPTYRSGDIHGSSFAMYFDDFQPVCSSLPGFFEKYGLRQPVGKTNIPATFAFGADGRLTIWEVLAQKGTEHIEQFGRAMQAMTNYGWPYTGAYDFEWVADYATTNSERTLIVDVGGSYGHALRANLVKYSRIPPSRCAVEDRPEMIPSIQKKHASDTVMKDVQKVAADFHKEQPIKGALIYFIRRCLHDYDDDDCVNILKILASSLPEDEPQARILINEQIMTDPPDRLVAAMDITMLTWASLERSEQQFAELAKRAGLVVVKVHKAEGATMGIVECKKALPL